MTYALLLRCLLVCVLHLCVLHLNETEILSLFQVGLSVSKASSSNGLQSAFPLLDAQAHLNFQSVKLGGACRCVSGCAGGAAVPGPAAGPLPPLQQPPQPLLLRRASASAHR